MESKELDNLSVEDYITANLSTEFARNLVRSVVKTACGEYFYFCLHLRRQMALLEA